MRILFFEPDITGHRKEYLNHLIDYVETNQSDNQFIFVVHSGFVAAGLSAGLILDPLQDSVRADLRVGPKSSNLPYKSIKAFKLADLYAKKHHADHVCFLNFNDVQFALGFFRPAYSISGILFKPFGQPDHGSIGYWLTYQRKYMQTWLFTRNPRLKTIFVLNDTKAAEFLNRIFKSDIFQMLPDPVPILTPEPDFNIREEYGIEPNRKIFLHIGSLLKRKGTLDILESLKFLTEEELSKFSLVILGHAEAEMDSIIRTYPPQPPEKSGQALPRPGRGFAPMFPRSRPPLPGRGRGSGGGYVSIIYRNQFLSPSVFKSCIDQCDLLLAPYKYNESSSGIAGHAIAAGKPLLGVRKGLLGEMIAEHGTGIFIDECKPVLIAEGIRKALSTDLKGKTSRRYVSQHTGEIFAANLIASISG